MTMFNMTAKLWIYLAGLVIACSASGGCSPSFGVPDAAIFTGESGGCGNFGVYRFNRNRTFAIDLGVDEKAVAIGEGSTEIDLENAPAGVKLVVMQFASPAGDYFCDDVADDPEPIARWTAVAGQVHVQCDRTPPPPSYGNATHRISVILENIKIRNDETGDLTTLPHVEIKDVGVGWLPG
jgi:hypothetical protein